MAIAQFMVRLALLLAAAGAWAQPAGDLASDLKVHRVAIAGDGKELIEPALSAKPGDVLEYTVAYRGKSAVRRLEATLPIPSGTEYLASSVEPAGAQASVDGAVFAAIPLKRKVRQADGKEVEQLVPYAEYRFLRWPPQDLAAGAVAKVSARVRLTTDTAPAGDKK